MTAVFLYLVAYLSSYHEKAIIALYELASKLLPLRVYLTKMGESR